MRPAGKAKTSRSYTDPQFLEGIVLRLELEDEQRKETESVQEE